MSLLKLVMDNLMTIISDRYALAAGLRRSVLWSYLEN